jgi:hypothetical protein
VFHHSVLAVISGQQLNYKKKIAAEINFEQSGLFTFCFSVLFT